MKRRYQLFFIYCYILYYPQKTEKQNFDQYEKSSSICKILSPSRRERDIEKFRTNKKTFGKISYQSHNCKGINADYNAKKI